MTATDHIELVFAPGTLPAFSQLLSDGVTTSALTGCSLKAFLCDQLGIGADYLERRIQTIFLNGKPVDDCETAHLTDGSVVALSAAMPGLAGATLRCGGVFAAMRGAITHQNTSMRTCDTDGTVRLKLFNLLIPELGPLLLARGIRLDQSSWRQLLADYRRGIQAGCRQVHLNGAIIETDRLGPMLPQTDRISLRMTELPSGRSDSTRVPDV